MLIDEGNKPDSILGNRDVDDGVQLVLLYSLGTVLIFTVLSFRIKLRRLDIGGSHVS